MQNRSRNIALNAIHRGSGRKLLLVHGLGSSWHSWSPILDRLAEHREIIALDLPGHGESPLEEGSGTFTGLVDSVENFIAERELRGIDMVGSSVGGRLVLELARRGGTGTVIALDPGGFWGGWDALYLGATLTVSVKLLRAIRPAIGPLSGNFVSRTALLAQLSARPWALPKDLVARELKSLAETPNVDPLIADLAYGLVQTGPAARDSGPILIGWGRHDRLCLPRQAKRAMTEFPSASMHWFAHSGHFPMWDQPEETADLILSTTEKGARHPA